MTGMRKHCFVGSSIFVHVSNVKCQLEFFMVFWGMTQCSDVLVYRHFRGLGCLHLQCGVFPAILKLIFVHWCVSSEHEVCYEIWL